MIKIEIMHLKLEFSKQNIVFAAHRPLLIRKIKKTIQKIQDKAGVIPKEVLTLQKVFNPTLNLVYIRLK